MNGATGASGNYIQFPDGTQQKTAPNTTSFASVNSSNTFLSQVSPSQPYQQIITGNNLSGNTNAPLVVKNIDTGEYCGFYIDPSTNYDVTLYSGQSSGGLTLRNVDGNSCSLTPSAPNNTAYFSNPLSCGTFPFDCGTLSASQLTLSSSGNSSILTTTATGLNVNDPIVSTGSFTGTQLTLSSGGNSSILTTTANGLSVNDDISGTSLTTTGILTAGSLKILSPSNDTLTLQSLTNFGLLIADTAGTNGKLTLSNNGSVYASMTCTAQNEFTFSGSTIVSSQTYPLTSSNQTATISYVNQAISSQGGGDASLTATQTFSGVNTFSNTAQTSSLQTFPQLSTNQFATYAYVNNIGETQSFNYLIPTCPQLTGAYTITFTQQGGPQNNAGQVKYNVNTSVSGSVYSYIDTWKYCSIIQSNLSPITNCIFTFSFATGTTPTTSNENVSIRVVNGGTQYTLPCVLINNNTQFQTTTPLTLTSSQSYSFYFQGSYI
jgi:hypothetical protein